MGGFLVFVDSFEVVVDLKVDVQFCILFQIWKKFDMLQQGVIVILLVQLVYVLLFISNFGICFDLFCGIVVMYVGVDILGLVGMLIYVIVDGIIVYVGCQGGYGNMVEINYGKGIVMCYGYLLKILVGDNVCVVCGQLIVLMGLIGCLIGLYFYYEVCIDGYVVNLVLFLIIVDYLFVVQDCGVCVILIMIEGFVLQD